MSPNETRSGPGWRLALRRLLVAATTVLSLVTAPWAGAPSWAATRIRVSTVLTSEVLAQDAKGGIVSVIDVCPVNSALDGARTRQLIEQPAPGVRLLSRELWPRGVVSRWRVTASDVFAGANVRQSAVCVEHLVERTSVHTATTTSIVRLWGPATAKAWIWAGHQTASHWSGRAVVSNTHLTRARGTRMRDVMSGLVFGDTAYTMGAPPSARVRPGHFSELRVRVATTSRPGRAPAPDNVHVPDFTVPKLGGGDLRWSHYTSGRVLVAAGSVPQTRAALQRLVATAAATPARQRVVGLVADLNSKDKFRPTTLAVIERRAGQLPAPTGYAVACPVVWLSDAAANTGQVADPFGAGLIAIVEDGVVRRYLPGDTSSAEIRKSLAATL